MKETQTNRNNMILPKGYLKENDVVCVWNSKGLTAKKGPSSKNLNECNPSYTLSYLFLQITS